MSDVKPMSDEELAALREFIGKDWHRTPDRNSAELWQRIIRLLARLDAPQAVVDQLPKDGEGNPVQIGMVYYTADGHGFNLGVDALGQIIDHWNNEVNEPVFLTRAAAEAAMKEQQDADV